MVRTDCCHVSKFHLSMEDRWFTVGRSSLLAPLLLVFLTAFLIAFLPISVTQAEDFDAIRQLFLQGKYDECVEQAKAEFERGVFNENWPLLLLKARLVRGQYQAALEEYEAAINRFPQSIGLRLVGHDVYNFVDRTSDAQRQYQEIISLVQRRAWRYSSSKDRVVLGRFLVAQGEDARDILELFYDRAKRSNSRYIETYLATAELALAKHDYQEAAKTLGTAAEIEPDNPQIHYLLARAWNSDSEKVASAVARALELNPRHVPTLLFQADNLIDAEKYDEANALLNQAFNVNPHDPEAWAYRAVIAHLRGKTKQELECRKKALLHWKTNPQVDHLIGRKLSRNYRFAEGAAYQRKSLQFDPANLAAKFQLSQDLLRTGDEATGWKLAAEVHDKDAYNVVAYNTLMLQQELEKFDAVESSRFVIRMDAREARIYGQQVLALLEEAHDEFVAKYEVTLEYPTIVEIFPKQKDFAIRTFGLPGGAGFLGVCFGRVVTANSPASQGAVPANWQSVLWHEFCHVVTLTKTKNKMPRWLSEGISTYEEQERNESWGERLNPAYFRMILSDEELTPVSQLSSAFLSPKSPLHLQFAYFESSLVVRYLIEKHGLNTLKRVLTDLGVGLPITEALTRYVGSIEYLDRDFEAYARSFAKDKAPNADWVWQKEWDESAPTDYPRLLKENPNNYGLLIRTVRAALQQKQYQVAEKRLLQLRSLYPEDRSAEGSLALLARLYAELEQPEKELSALTEFARLNDRALTAYKRLAELHLEAERWAEARDYALRYLAVQPMQPTGHRLLADAVEETNHPADLAAALAALLEMDPVDPAESHFRLATALQQSGKLEQAKRQVLKALEEAPRYRAAQRLLLALLDTNQSDVESKADSRSQNESRSEQPNQPVRDEPESEEPPTVSTKTKAQETESGRDDE